MTGFIQTSDIHIGECRSLSGYLERHRAVLWQITQAAEDFQLPLIIAGDLFHTKNTNYQEQLLAAEWLTDIDKRGIPTVLTAGNHDHLYGEVTQIDIFKYYNFRNVQVVGWQPAVVKLLDTNFLCLSWQDYTTEDLDRIVKTHLPQMQDTRYKVVVLHECLLGSVFDNGKPSPIGAQIPNIPEITYWVVGDIHKKQMTNVQNGFYAGAPAMFKFEDVREKGILKVNLDQPHAPEFLTIRSKPLLTVDKVEDIKEDAYYQVKGSLTEILAANNNDQVVRTRWEKSLAGPIEYPKLSLIDGLAEFLAAKGVETDLQQFAVDWVTQGFIKEGTGG